MRTFDCSVGVTEMNKSGEGNRDFSEYAEFTSCTLEISVLTSVTEPKPIWTTILLAITELCGVAVAH
jgi:hypothetical protein